MINPYIIILSLFLIAGLIATVWGWRIIVQGRKTLCWPSIDGIIEASLKSSPVSNTESNHESFPVDPDQEELSQYDLIPYIEYSYTVNGKSYKQHIDFPGDISPTKEFVQSYLEKFPVGANIPVYFNPEIPDQSTLEPGSRQGDWLVFAFGIGAAILGISFLFFN